VTRLSRFYMQRKMREIAVAECFFFGLFAKNQSTFLCFSFVTIILEIIFTTKKAINSARTPTSSKTIVKM